MIQSTNELIKRKQELIRILDEGGNTLEETEQLKTELADLSSTLHNLTKAKLKDFQESVQKTEEKFIQCKNIMHTPDELITTKYKEYYDTLICLYRKSVELTFKLSEYKKYIRENKKQIWGQNNG